MSYPDNLYEAGPIVKQVHDTVIANSNAVTLRPFKF